MKIRPLLILSFALIGVLSASIFLILAFRFLNEMSSMRTEALEYARTVQIQWFLAAIIVIFVAVGTGAIIASHQYKSINKMIQSSQQVTQGNIEAFQPSASSSEVGDLSRSVYAMILALKDEISRKQQHLDDRLKLINYQNEKGEAIAQIGREVASQLDAHSILKQAVRLISNKFGYYQVALYEVEETGEYAVLCASSSPDGENSLPEGYKIKIGERSMVGYVAHTGKARISYDVATDPFISPSVEFPDTRSEATLPLRFQNKVIGVLDAHATSLGAFSFDDLRTLHIIADQLALGLVNTRLRAEVKQLRSELDQVYGQQVTRTWEYHLRGGSSTFYYSASGIVPVMPPQPGQMIFTVSGAPVINHEANELTVPVMIRDQVIGHVVLRRDAGSSVWNEEDIQLVREVLEQISPALESARLLEETQARVQQEQAVNIISTQVRRSASIDAILQNTVRELGRALGGARTFIQIGSVAGENQIEIIDDGHEQEDGD